MKKDTKQKATAAFAEERNAILRRVGVKLEGGYGGDEAGSGGGGGDGRGGGAAPRWWGGIVRNRRNKDGGDGDGDSGQRQERGTQVVPSPPALGRSDMSSTGGGGGGGGRDTPGGCPSSSSDGSANIGSNHVIESEKKVTEVFHINEAVSEKKAGISSSNEAVSDEETGTSIVESSGNKQHGKLRGAVRRAGGAAVRRIVGGAVRRVGAARGGRAVQSDAGVLDGPGEDKDNDGSGSNSNRRSNNGGSGSSSVSSISNSSRGDSTRGLPTVALAVETADGRPKLAAGGGSDAGNVGAVIRRGDKSDDYLKPVVGRGEEGGDHLKPVVEGDDDEGRGVEAGVTPMICEERGGVWGARVRDGGGDLGATTVASERQVLFTGARLLVTGER